MFQNNSNDNLISFRSAAIIGAIIVISYIFIITVFQNSDNRVIFSDIFTPIINILVVLCLFYAAKRSKIYGKRIYRAWILLACAQLIFAFGDISWLIVEVVLAQNPFPSAADVFYVIYYPLFVIGIFMLPAYSLKKRDIYKTLLDMGIITISFALIFWIFLVWPTLELGEIANQLSLTLNLYYLVADFLLLFALFYLLFKIKNLKEISLILLAGGITAQIISDIVFAHFNLMGNYMSGSIADSGWLIGYILIGLAGIYQATKVRDKLVRLDEVDLKENFSSISFIPIVWVIITYILIPWAYNNVSAINLTILEIGVGVSIFLVMLRQFMSSNENKMLYLNAQKEIFQRKITEKALKESEMQYHTTVASIDNPLHVINKELKIVIFNESFMNWNKEFGFENEVLGKYLLDVFPFLENNVVKEYQDVFNNGKMVISEEFNKINGKKIYTETKKIPIFEDNEVIRVITIIRDITEQKTSEEKIRIKAEEAIKRQKALLQISKTDISVIEDALKGLTEIDSNVLNVERVSVWFLNKDKSGIYCVDLFKKSEKTHEHGEILLEKEYPQYFKAIKREYNIAAVDARNDIRTFEFKKSYLEPLNIISMMDIPIWLHGNLVGVLCHEHVGEQKRKWTFEDQDFASSIAHMVTLSLEADERKNAEKRLIKSLNEKELLLKEVHHRVKNNMQIMSSLINIQSRYIDDQETLDVFKESQSRIRSMALVHEEIYQSDDFTRIDFGDYIRKMTSALYKLYGVPYSVKLYVDAENVLLGIETAIPCGLIINELITNSIKHAFPFIHDATIEDLKEAEIKIKISQKGNILNFVISDNGVGIPEDMNLKEVKSLGLRLVKMLNDQISGEIELDRSIGTTFKISFEEKEDGVRI